MYQRLATKVFATPVYDLFPLPEVIRKFFPRHQVVHSTCFGVRHYTITHNHPQLTKKWSKEVWQIYYLLKSDNQAELATVLAGKNYKKDIRKVLSRYYADGYGDDESLKLIAIGMWVFKNADSWAGFLRIANKILRGGRHDVTTFLQKGSHPCCLDVASLTHVLAAEMGVKGEIKRKRGPYGHRYWQSASGKVVDARFGAWRGGVFNNLAQYVELTKNRYLVYKVKKLILSQVMPLFKNLPEKYNR